MKRAMALLFYVLIGAGCSACHKMQVTFDSPELQYYEEKFVQDGRDVGKPIQVSDLEVHFSNDPALAQEGAATCIRDFNATPKIEILKYFWDKYDDLQKEAIIYHEFGHCILNREHVPGSEIIGGKIHTASIMYPIAISAVSDEPWYQQHRRDYMVELFSTVQGGAQ